jgi:hypothetical protein
VENSLSRTICTFHLLGSQFSNVMYILLRSTHIFKILIGVEIHRDTWYCESKELLKMRKTTHFQTLIVLEKITQYNGRYRPWAQILRFIRRRVHRLDLKISHIIKKRALHIFVIWKWKETPPLSPPPPPGK